MHEFMRAAHHYMTELEEPLPPRTALAEWMSLGRHYGIPSRLIDFSYSRYVALYFALHDWNSDDDSYVLCINAQWLVDQVHPEKRLNKLLKDKASLP
ncbi:MAG: FRG domain-containing protein [Nitrososphaera sp.]|nr:FRG domain-containing protein [Nitrososphaera sp.]